MAGGHPLLAIAGEIDLATVPQLHNALARAINDNASVIVDLDGVYACDDTGLGVLLGAAGRAREAGGDLMVVCSEGPFRHRLARTGFDRAVTVTDTVSDAVTKTERTGPVPPAG